jgi:hypothetical protein
MKDGWVLGPNSELLFWVPPSLRVGLLRPRTKLLIGPHTQTRLNLDSFAHGVRWTLCETQDNPSNQGISDGEPFATPESSPGSSGKPDMAEAARYMPGDSSGHAKPKTSKWVRFLSGIVRKKGKLEGT